MNNLLKLTLCTFVLVTLNVRATTSIAEEGPAERAGKHVDNTAEAVGDSAEDVKKNAVSAGRQVKEDTKATSEKVADSAGDVADNAKGALKQVGKDTKENAEAVADSASQAVKNAKSAAKSVKDSVVGEPEHEHSH